MSESNSPGNPFRAADVVKTPEADKVITVEVQTAVDLDGQRFVPGITTKVSVKQWRALSRHLKWVGGPEAQDPANKTFVEKSKKRLDAREKSLATAAALSLLLLSLLFLPAAQASPPSTYGFLPLPPMISLLPTNGTTTATNGIMGAGTNTTGVTCAAAQTNTWVSQTNAQGIPTNVISLTRFDELFITLTAGTSNNVNGPIIVTNTFWQGDGTLTNWDTNRPVFVLTLTSTGAGTNAVLCTNISRNLLGSSGHIVCGTIGVPTGDPAVQNINLEIQVKPIRSGN